MKKITLTFILFIGFYGFSIAQTTQLPHTCGTEVSDDYLQDVYDGVFRQNPISIRKTNAGVEIPVQFHLLANPSGTGALRMSDAFELLCKLNDAYNPNDIRFYMHSYPKKILTSSFNINTRSISNALIMQYNEAYVVNIYVGDLSAQSNPGTVLCGYANLPGSGARGPVPPGGSANHNRGAIVLNVMNNCSNPNTSTTLTHEMGHFLSLLHPFQTTSTSPDASTSEFVARTGANSNCNTAGDGLCDTEADYIDLNNGFGWAGCVQSPTNGNIVDFHGAKFQPNPTYYMCYSPDNCQNKFSTQQGQQVDATVSLPPNNNRSRSYLTLYPAPPEVTLGAANPLLPAAGATKAANYVPMSWSAVANASSYHLQISNNPQFSVTIFETILNTNAYLYTGNSLINGQTYYWRVKPLTRAYTCAPYSPGNRTFRATTPFPTGVEELSEYGLRVFPTLLQNGQQNVQIFFEDLKEDFTQIQLFDMNGKLLKTQQINSIVKGDLVEFNLENQASGVYFLKIQSNNKVLNQKIVVAN